MPDVHAFVTPSRNAQLEPPLCQASCKRIVAEVCSLQEDGLSDLAGHRNGVVSGAGQALPESDVVEAVLWLGNAFSCSAVIAMAEVSMIA